MYRSKKKAVRMLDSAYEIVVGFSMSDQNAGRLAKDMRAYQKELNRLMRHDPYQKFWKVLGNANQKLIRYIRNVQG